MIPRGSPKLMFRVALSDYRERIYESIGKLVDTPRGALAFLAEAGDRLEGKPTQRHEVTTPRMTVFQRDDTPAPPPVQGSGGAPTPPLAEGVLVGENGQTFVAVRETTRLARSERANRGATGE